MFQFAFAGSDENKATHLLVKHAIHLAFQSIYKGL